MCLAQSLAFFRNGSPCTDRTHGCNRFDLASAREKPVSCVNYMRSSPRDELLLVITTATPPSSARAQLQGAMLRRKRDGDGRRRRDRGAVPRAGPPDVVITTGGSAHVRRPIARGDREALG